MNFRGNPLSQSYVQYKSKSLAFASWILAEEKGHETLKMPENASLMYRIDSFDSSEIDMTF